jgi:hypothetical protein
MSVDRASGRLLAAAVLLLAGAAPARAHHGKDFLVVETYELPRPGHVFLLSNQDLVRAGGATGYEWSPGVLLGVTDRFAAEVHAHFEKEPDGDWSFAEIAPAVRLQLTPPGRRVNLALSGEYEFGRGEVPDHVEGRFIVGYRGRLNLAGNLVVGHVRGGEGTEVGYAVGVRSAREDGIALGAEAQGNFHGAHFHEVLGGVYFTPSERLTVKVAVGTGFGDEGPDLTIRTGLVLGF